jgi:hypothetical protein
MQDLSLQEAVEQLVSIAQSVEAEDPIDWGMLSIDEQTAYRMIATSVVDNYLQTPPETRDTLLLATVVKLSVENFVLNMKLMSSQ